jgi:hypothetical protein
MGPVGSFSNTPAALNPRAPVMPMGPGRVALTSHGTVASYPAGTSIPLGALVLCNDTTPSYTTTSLNFLQSP